MAVDERFAREAEGAVEEEALLGTRNEIITGPVSDWATDFSHASYRSSISSPGHSAGG